MRYPAYNTVSFFQRLLLKKGGYSDKKKNTGKLFSYDESIHLFKVISERFQSHFSEYALMILK